MASSRRIRERASEAITFENEVSSSDDSEPEITLGPNKWLWPSMVTPAVMTNPELEQVLLVGCTSGPSHRAARQLTESPRQLYAGNMQFR